MKQSVELFQKLKTSFLNSTADFGFGSSHSCVPAHLLPRYKAGYLLIQIPENEAKSKRCDAPDTACDWHNYVVALAGSDTRSLSLYYYENATSHKPLGEIELHSAQIDVLQEVLMVITDKNTWFLCAEDADEAEDWANCICSMLESATIDSVVPLSPEKRRRRCSSSIVTSATITEIQSRDISSRVAEFRDLFFSGGSNDELRIQATKSGLIWSCCRNISWKIWLGILDADNTNSWIKDVANQRQTYAEICTQFPVLSNSTILKVIGSVETAGNVEAETEDILLYDICKDVRRTGGNLGFFSENIVKCMLVRILYVYAKSSPDISYNQGMNEILAVILYLLHVEKWPGTGCISDEFDEDVSYVHVSFSDVLFIAPLCHPFSETTSCVNNDEDVKQLLLILTDGRYNEHDAFVLFEQIMKRMSSTFCPTKYSTISNYTASSGVAVQQVGCQLEDHLHRIHYDILLANDEELETHFSKMRIDVQPSHYLLRWLRLLFAREFPIYNVWQIWDAIFALTPENFILLDFICAAAVTEIRLILLQEKEMTGVLACMRDLESYVQVEKLVEVSCKLYQRKVLEQIL